MDRAKTTAARWWDELRSPLEPLTKPQVALLVLTSLFVAATRLFARSKSLWDWDEALFASALSDYDVARHHPHPPGFPLFIALSKLVRLFVTDDFRALQSVVVASAMFLFPALFFFARSLRFPFSTSFVAASLLAFLPQVVVYGGTAHSDVVALVLVLFAGALLLASDRWFAVGVLLLALSIAVRPQNILIGLAPLIIAVAASWARSRRATFAALAMGAAVILAFYGAAAIVTGIDDYRAAVEDHRAYVQRVDSFRNPERPPLGELFKVYFVNATRSGGANYVFDLLLVIALVAAIRRRSAPVAIALATFLPYQLFAWLMLDPAGHGRLSLGYIALYPILAAYGLTIATSWVGKRADRRALFMIATTLILTLALAYRSARVVQLLRRTLSPPVAAAEWIRANVPITTPLVVGPSLRAHFNYLLPEYTRYRQDAPEGGRGGVLVAQQIPAGTPSVFFSRDRTHLWKIVRHSNFEVHITRPISETD